MKRSNIFWNFRTVRTLLQETQIVNFSIKKVCKTKTLSTLTPIEETQPVVSVEFDFENRENMKLKGFL